jgi:hypothetical protein
LHEHVGAVDAAHEQPLEDQREQTYTERRADYGCGVAAGQVIQRVREIGSQHVQGAMHEVGDLERAEDQRQARGHQEQQHAADETAGGLRDDARRG